MNREEMRVILERASPRAPAHNIEQYLSALETWQEADANIREHGAIAIHPRTGAPFDNPYLKVRTASWRLMQDCKGVRADALWAKLREESTLPTPSP